MAQLLDWGIKDPEAVLNYALDWSRWLQQGDVITSVTAQATDVTINQTTFTPTVVTVILSGGTRGSVATVKIHINTQGGLQDERTVTLNIDDR